MLESDAQPQGLKPDGGAHQLEVEPGAAPTVEISNAISHLHKKFIGRGPTNARTTIDGNLVVCLLEGGYTQAEQTLEDSEHGDVVLAARLGLQAAMRDALIDAVEGALGRSVLSFMSANDIRRNLQVEVFVMVSSSEGNAGTRD